MRESIEMIYPSMDHCRLKVKNGNYKINVNIAGKYDYTYIS